MDLLFIGIISVLVVVWIERKSLRRFFGVSRRRHRRNIARSKKIISKLQAAELPQMLAYLRKIDPYVFEEVLLTAFAAQGYRVARNRSYSGDGGMDGRIHVEGRCYLIQAKRYGGPINTAHVRSFAALVAREKNVAGGFFIHTGKTPAATWQTVSGCDAVMIISGQKLVDLIRGTKYCFSL